MSRRKVDDCCDAHAGTAQHPDAQRYVARPHAHRSDGPVAPHCPSAQRPDVGVGGTIAQLGEVEQCKGSPGLKIRIIRHDFHANSDETTPYPFTMSSFDCGCDPKFDDVVGKLGM